jgi:hypothetical protein
MEEQQILNNVSSQIEEINSAENAISTGVLNALIQTEIDAVNNGCAGSIGPVLPYLDVFQTEMNSLKLAGITLGWIEKCATYSVKLAAEKEDGKYGQKISVESFWKLGCAFERIKKEANVQNLKQK